MTRKLAGSHCGAVACERALSPCDQAGPAAQSDKTAIAAAHGEAAAEKCSTYYMADEIASTYRGLMIAVDEDAWSRQYADLTPSRLARGLRSIAKDMRLSHYAKNPWRPKKKAAKVKKKKLKHVATARILEERKLLANPGKC